MFDFTITAKTDRARERIFTTPHGVFITSIMRMI